MTKGNPFGLPFLFAKTLFSGDSEKSQGNYTKEL